MKRPGPAITFFDVFFTDKLKGNGFEVSTRYVPKGEINFKATLKELETADYRQTSVSEHCKNHTLSFRTLYISLKECVHMTRLCVNIYVL